MPGRAAALEPSFSQSDGETNRFADGGCGLCLQSRWPDSKVGAEKEGRILSGLCAPTASFWLDAQARGRGLLAHFGKRVE